MPRQQRSEQPDGLPSFAVDTDRHREVIRQLTAAFDEKQLVTVLVGDSSIELSHLMGAFVAGLADRASIVRLKDPHTDALAAMREINRALGFAPKALGLTEQRKILAMFLECQAKYRRRTLLCIEQADQQPLWLLDTLASLIGPASPGGSALTVALAVGSAVERLLSEPSLEVFRDNAGRPIRLAPFTLRETREFVRRRVEMAGLGEVSRLFDFEAVDHLHRLSGGKPDTVGQLCQQSLSLTKPSEDRPVTVESVVQVARELHLQPVEDTLVDISEFDTGEDLVERLVVRLNGRPMQEIPIKDGDLLVGRDIEADICLPGSLVSRRHALINKTGGSTSVKDLDSTNGTFVGGQRISEYTLRSDDIINVGDFELQYKSGSKAG